MHRQIRRVLAAGGAALSALGIAVASVACGGTTAPQAPEPSGGSGAQLWIQRYKLPANSGPGFAQVVAVSPRGDKVYMTGEGATVAYSAATGARLWAGRGGASVTVSPDGAKVFVIGGTGSPGQRGPQSTGYATVAYNAATGAQLWAKRYSSQGKSPGPAGARSVVVSPGGDKVFVTGISAGAGSGPDYATVAYNAATGAQLWVRRYNGPGNGEEMMGLCCAPQAMAVSRDGATVFVTGASKGTGTGLDYATVAYNAATGKQLWVSRYNGPANRDDGAGSVAVSPDGARVFVTGGSQGAGADYATVAYKAATGKQLWVSRYNGPGNRDDAAGSVAVSPNGATVFVAGTSTGTATGEDYATIAYNAATGKRLWLQRYNGPQNRDENAYAMALSPSGAKVYVTGHRPDDRSGATVAYNASTGAQLWVTRPAYNPTSVAVTPNGATVFVAGYISGPGSGGYVTVAYRG